MSQAEIAAGQVTPADELPSKGRQLRDFKLASMRGIPVQLSDYRGRCNLVLVFTGNGRQTTELLSEITARCAEFKNEEAQIIAIARPSFAESADIGDRMEHPYPMLLDNDGRLHRAVGASDPKGGDAAAVYVTDRFFEVFGLYRTRDGQALPTATEVLKWLEFINAQCPECEAPEWPV